MLSGCYELKYDNDKSEDVINELKVMVGKAFDSNSPISYLAFIMKNNEQQRLLLQHQKRDETDIQDFYHDRIVYLRSTACRIDTYRQKFYKDKLTICCARIGWIVSAYEYRQLFNKEKDPNKHQIYLHQQKFPLSP